MHSDLYSGSCRSSFSGNPDIPRNFRNSAEHTSELNHSRARLIWSGIPDSGIPAGIPEAFYATCNKHSACGLKNNTKSRCQRWHSACCCFRTPPQACHHCCHCSLFPSPLPSPSPSPSPPFLLLPRLVDCCFDCCCRHRRLRLRRCRRHHRFFCCRVKLIVV